MSEGLIYSIVSEQCLKATTQMQQYSCKLKHDTNAKVALKMQILPAVR